MFHPHAGAVCVERPLLPEDGGAHLDGLEALPRYRPRPLREARLPPAFVGEHYAGSLLLPAVGRLPHEALRHLDLGPELPLVSAVLPLDVDVEVEGDVEPSGDVVRADEVVGEYGLVLGVVPEPTHSLHLLPRLLQDRVVDDTRAVLY